MSNILTNVFSAIAQEADANPRFRARILEALRADAGGADGAAITPQKAMQRNRRQKAVLDPYAEIINGDEALRTRLLKLNVEQLKDIVSEYSLDSSRLALKWKSAERLVDLITQTIRARLEKGDAFRS